jgi:hypothetical protein
MGNSGIHGKFGDPWSMIKTNDDIKDYAFGKQFLLSNLVVQVENRTRMPLPFIVIFPSYGQSFLCGRIPTITRKN